MSDTAQEPMQVIADDQPEDTQDQPQPIWVTMIDVFVIFAIIGFACAWIGGR